MIQSLYDSYSAQRKRKAAELDLDDSKPEPMRKKIRITAPVQYATQLEIDKTNDEIANLVERSRQAFVNQDEIKQEIETLQQRRKQCQVDLQKLKNAAKASGKYRKKNREIRKRYAAEHPEEHIIIQDKPGRPNIEKYYPHFSCILLEIMVQYCATGNPMEHQIINNAPTIHHQ